MSSAVLVISRAMISTNTPPPPSPRFPPASSHRFDFPKISTPSVLINESVGSNAHHNVTDQSINRANNAKEELKQAESSVDESSSAVVFGKRARLHHRHRLQLPPKIHFGLALSLSAGSLFGEVPGGDVLVKVNGRKRTRCSTRR